jgi:hypothetical protein
MTTQSTGTTPSVIEELVGEGKKFRDIEALAQSVKEKDAFIPRLQEENKELRSLLRATETANERINSMADILEKVKGNLAGTTNTGAVVGDPKASDSINNQTTGLSREEVRKLFDEYEETKRADRNKAVVNKRLFDVYGDKAPETLAKKADELGVSVDTLQDLAKRSPTAALNMLGIPVDNNKVATQVQGGHRNSVNTDALTTNGAQTNIRNRSYYDTVKKEMGVTKFALNRELQIQMHKDMASLGEDFFT